MRHEGGTGVEGALCSPSSALWGLLAVEASSSNSVEGIQVSFMPRAAGYIFVVLASPGITSLLTDGCQDTGVVSVGSACGVGAVLAG